MKAVLVPQVGAAPEIGDVHVPEPGEGEILVKTVYTAVNPVDTFMATTGLLVDSWPLTPGCDVAGIVVKAGANATSALGKEIKEGDAVFSCSRLGMKKYAAWEEYLLMDAQVTIPKPDNISLAQASTMGVALLTACLGVFDGLGIEMPGPNAPLPEPRGEWALVFGGAGSVGQSAVQLLKACGFKVVTTCSKKSGDLLKSLGADEVIDYKLSEAEIIEEIKRATNSHLNYAFDAVSVNNDLITAIFAALPKPDKPRLYTTTNDWDPTPKSTPTNPFTSATILLGEIGRPGKAVNTKITSYIPLVYKLLETGKVKPSEYSVEGEGVEGILKAWEVQKSGVKGSVKVVVKVGEE